MTTQTNVRETNAESFLWAKKETNTLQIFNTQSALAYEITAIRVSLLG